VRICEKELISDWGLKSIVTLNSGKLETPNPDIESGKSHGKVQKTVKGVKGPVDWVLEEDSSRGSKEIIRLEEGD
jgi:hypothetical protein